MPELFSVRIHKDIDLFREALNMVQLVRQKLAVPGNEAVDVSNQRLMRLAAQVEAQLKPVLREIDFNEFDLQRAFRMVAAMEKALVA